MEAIVVTRISLLLCGRPLVCNQGCLQHAAICTEIANADVRARQANGSCLPMCVHSCAWPHHCL